MSTSVEQVMSSPVHVVTPSTSFKELVRQIETHKVSALPVVDAEGRLVGLVSEADLLLKEDRESVSSTPGIFQTARRRTQQAKAAGTTAADLMTSPVITIGPAATVVEAAQVMQAKSIKRLPVVDEAGHVVGIISRSDVLKVFERDDLDIRREIIEDVIIRTLWLDPMTVKVTCTSGIVELEGLVDRKGDVPILVRLAERVNGVVSVKENLSYRYDDTKSRSDYLSPLPPVRW